MKYSDKPWIVLFGGAGREGVIKALQSAAVPVVKILVPRVQSPKLCQSVAQLRNLSIPVQEIRRSEIELGLTGHEEAVILSVGFPYIIPKSLFSRHLLALNIHPTLLPKYRGPTTGAYVLINNESHSGATVHLMEAEVDKGSIVAQSKVALSPFDTLRSMQRKVYSTEPALLLEAIRKLESGFVPVEQAESDATVYPKVRVPEDSVVDPQQPLIELVNQIRACDSEAFPAYFMYHGEKVCIKIWRPCKAIDQTDLI